jgi:hypothetical protein
MPMIGFDAVVAILSTLVPACGADLSFGFQFPDRSGIAAAPIYRKHVWRAVIRIGKRGP